jgi:hypothetical protein
MADAMDQAMYKAAISEYQAQGSGLCAGNKEHKLQASRPTTMCCHRQCSCFWAVLGLEFWFCTNFGRPWTRLRGSGYKGSRTARPQQMGSVAATI